MRDEFPTNPATKLPVPRVPSPDSPEALALLQARMPFACKIDDWPASKWSISYLQEKIGHVPRRLVRASDGVEVTMPMAEVLGMMERDPGWKSSYLPVEVGTTPILLTSTSPFAGLLADVHLPKWVPAEHAIRVMTRNSLANAQKQYFETACHYEGTAQPAIYVQLAGRKHLWLFGPEQSPFLGVESFLGEPPFMSNGADACSDPSKYPELAKATCYEIVLEPGDFVYWPEFWYHWFVHYHDFQMNLRIDWNAPELQLNPATASWAFSNALAHALGGFEHIESKLKAMPPDVQQLLVGIEQALIKHPELLASGALVEERTLAMRVDTTKYTPPAAKPPSGD